MHTYIIGFILNEANSMEWHVIPKHEVISGLEVTHFHPSVVCLLGIHLIFRQQHIIILKVHNRLEKAFKISKTVFIAIFF